MGVNISRVQPTGPLTEGSFQDLLDNLFSRNLDTVQRSLHYQGRPVHLDALLGELGKRLDPNELTWKGQRFNRAQFSRLQKQLQTVNDHRQQKTVTDEDLDKIFNILTTTPFTAQQAGVLLNNMQFRRKPIHPPQLMFGGPEFFFTSYEERLQYADEFSWKGRVFNVDKAKQLIDRLDVHFNGNKNSKQLSDEQVDEIIRVLITNEQSDLTDNIVYKGNTVYTPGLLLISCRRTEPLRCQGMYFTSTQLKKIRKALKNFQKQLIHDFEEALDGDDDAYARLKQYQNSKLKRAHTKNIREMKEVFHGGNLDLAVEKMTLGGHPLYSPDEVNHILVIISENTFDSDKMERLADLLEWENRYLSSEQINKVIFEQ